MSRPLEKTKDEIHRRIKGAGQVFKLQPILNDLSFRHFGNSRNVEVCPLSLSFLNRWTIVLLKGLFADKDTDEIGILTTVLSEEIVHECFRTEKRRAGNWT